MERPECRFSGTAAWVWRPSAKPERSLHFGQILLAHHSKSPYCSVSEMQFILSIPTIIFAGGNGSRIGGDKELRLLGGESLLLRSINQAGKYSRNIAVAARTSSHTDLPAGISVLVDRDNHAGPISGLMSAFCFARDCNSQHVLTMPCDTPFLPDDLLEKLYANIGNAGVSIAQSDGNLHATCALWSIVARHALSDYLVTGRRSLIGFAEAVGYVAVEWQSDPHDPFFNVNTSRDLADAEAIIAKRS